MRGLSDLPTTDQLQSAYAELQASLRTHAPLSEPRIALLSQWSRLDPRLAEQVAEQILAHWRSLNPSALKFETMKQPWPTALAVILEQLLEKLKTERPASNSECREFALWTRLITCGMTVEWLGLFFIGTRAVGGRLMMDDARLSLQSYSKWGFAGRDVFVTPKSTRNRRAKIAAATRQNAVTELIQTQRHFTVRDYWEQLGRLISLRQAQLDLHSDPRLKSVGSTRAKFYKSKH